MGSFQETRWCVFDQERTARVARFRDLSAGGIERADQGINKSRRKRDQRSLALRDKVSVNLDLVVAKYACSEGWERV